MKRQPVGQSRARRLPWRHVVLMATVLGAVPSVVRAQEVTQVAPAEQVKSFDIPPQALASALTAFARQSGLQVSADAALVRGATTRGVVGTLTASRALAELLAGTGLVFRFSDARTVTLDAGTSGAAPGATHLDPVQVQGVFPVPPQAMIDNLPPPYAGGQVATGGQLGLLGNRPVMDTPFNQTNYTAQKAQDQQAKTVRDVLIDDPSVRNVRSASGFGSDNVYIRGFPVHSGNSSYGGLFGILPRDSIMAQLAERIEVLNGPSAMLNGMSPVGAIGGTINVVPKRAPDEDLTQVTANYASAAQFGGHADVGRRFGADKQFGVRLNGVYSAGQTDVKWNTDERALALIGLDFRGEHLRLSADLGYQIQNIGGVAPYLGVANGVPLPWAPNARDNPAAQPWGEIGRKDLFGVARAEIDMTETVTAHIAIGAHDYRVGGLYSSRVVTSNFTGASTAEAPQNISQYGSFLTLDAGVRALADTGPIHHELALSATTYQQALGSVSVLGTAYATNIYNPVVIARPGIATPAANKTSTSTLSSLGIADTLSAADKRVQLTVGARLQQVGADNFNPTTGVRTSSYDQGALSPAVALVFKPWQNVSVYGNWIQGLQQGAVVGPAFTNAGEIFPPYKSTQYEAGVKVDWGKFTTTASVFQISQPSILTNVASNTQFLGGEQRNQGLELNVFGEPIEGVRLLGGVMFLNAVLAKTQGNVTDGWIAPFSPGVSLNLSGEWDLPFVRGLTLNGRVVYTGSQYIDTTWPRRSLPDWTRFDLGARYAFENPGAKGKLLVARFSVENVLDANYWAGGDSATSLYLGTPRTFRLALTADF